MKALDQIYAGYGDNGQAEDTLQSGASDEDGFGTTNILKAGFGG